MRKFFYVNLIIILAFVFCGVKLPNNRCSITIITKNSKYTLSIDKNESFYGQLSNSYLLSLASKIAKDNKINAKNSNVVFNKKTKDIDFTKEVYGYQVDEEDLINQLKLLPTLDNGNVVLKYNEIEPTIKRQDLVGKVFKRGSFWTSFAPIEDRVNNILLATNSISGSVVYPNEIFSFNKVVGERTEKKGFKPAKIIVSGEFVDGIGGGVCQVSTTLYNAVLLSGLKVVEHHQHSLAVSYVEQSFDAMVSGDIMDLKFKNTTEQPIYVFGYVENDRVYFCVYGEEMKVKYKRQSVIIEKIVPKIQYIENENLDYGEQRIVKNAKNGYVSEAYLLTFKNDELINKEKLREDKYLAINGVIEVKEIEDF